MHLCQKTVFWDFLIFISLYYMIIATPQLHALIYKDYICYKENQYSVSVLLALYFYIISTSTSTSNIDVNVVD